MRLEKPLERMSVSQPYGVDWVGQGWYASFGLKGHNGIDLRCRIGTDCYAALSGTVTLKENESIGKQLRVYGNGYMALYGHLDTFDVKDGERVEAGQLVARTGNSGKYTTGPHLHFALYETLRGTRTVLNSGNGYNGAIDPSSLFPKDWDRSPAYFGYGVEPAMSRAAFAPHYLYAMRAFGRTLAREEYNALRYGRWGLRDVMDPAMMEYWSEMTRPEFDLRRLAGMRNA